MGTIIFETFEDFLNREDKKVNGVSPEFADKNPNYIEYNDSNISCWNCIECIDCKGCYDCESCDNCTDCVECEDCKNCKSLEGCRGYINNIKPGYKEKVMQIINICIEKGISFQYYQSPKVLEIFNKEWDIIHCLHLTLNETEDKLNNILKSL